MNIHDRKRDKPQETPPEDSQSIYTDNTVQQEKVSPPPVSFPPQPARPKRRRRWFIICLGSSLQRHWSRPSDGPRGHGKYHLLYNGTLQPELPQWYAGGHSGGAGDESHRRWCFFNRDG